MTVDSKLSLRIHVMGIAKRRTKRVNFSQPKT